MIQNNQKSTPNVIEPSADPTAQKQNHKENHAAVTKQKAENPLKGLIQALGGDTDAGMKFAQADAMRWAESLATKADKAFKMNEAQNSMGVDAEGKVGIKHRVIDSYSERVRVHRGWAYCMLYAVWCLKGIQA